MPKSDPVDYLHKCNNQGTPIPQFEQMFCERCLQPECSRSLAGKTKFEARVANWQERLFKDPKTMSKDDPRWSKISGQKFLEVPTGHLPVIGSDWVDPRNLVETKASEAAPKPQKVEPRKAAPPPPEPDFESEPTSPEPDETPEPVAPPEIVDEPTKLPQNAPQPARRLQTPFQPGAMLKEVPSKPTQKDPWSAPIPAKDSKGEHVLKPGQKYRFGK